VCLLEDVVDDCKQCIQKSLPQVVLNALDNGQLTGTIICDLKVVSSYFDHFKKRQYHISEIVISVTQLTILKEKATANNW